MNLVSQRLLSIALCLVQGFIGCFAGLPAGMEFKQLTYCGKIRMNHPKKLLLVQLLPSQLLLFFWAWDL